MFRFLSLAMFIFYSNLIQAADVDLETTYAKQIAWAASNIDNNLVTKSFKESFYTLLNDSQKIRQLQTKEGQKVLQQGRNLLAVVELKEKLSRCLFFAEPAARQVVQALNSAMALKALDNATCMGSLDEYRSLRNFSRDLENSTKENAKTEILINAQKQLEATKSYWEKSSQQNHLDIAVDLTEKVQEETPPQEGMELLLYTQAIQQRKNKGFVGTADVKNAFEEVKNELKNHQEYLTTVLKESPEDALKSLIVSNPAATAQFLMEKPESFNIICKAINSYDFKVKRQEQRDKTIFWGGLVVGGALLIAGGMVGGAFLAPEIGTAALSEAAAAGTLTAVAARTAVAGAVTSGGETLYGSSKAYQSYIEAKNIRASAFAEGLNSYSIKQAEESSQQAYSDLADAGFSAVTIIPFGSGFNVMKKTIQAARLGSFSRVAKEGKKVEEESVKLLAVTLKEVSADKAALKILEKSTSKVSPDEMGMFLGYLSDFSPDQKKRVLDLIKQKPEKASDAIRESSKAGVCR